MFHPLLQIKLSSQLNYRNLDYCLTMKKSDGPTKCTEHDKTGAITQAHKSTVFSQANSSMPSTWCLLDNQSACDIVSNPKLARNIRQVEGHMQLATQAGSTTACWMADVPGCYRPVWFHPGGIANVLSVVNMIEKHHVTHDSRGGQHPNAFCVHKKDGTIRKFQQSGRGLCCLDTAAQNNHTVPATATVEANKSECTNRDCSHAQLARKIQNLVGRPKLKDLLRCLDSNSLPNCPMQRQDAVNADAMFGRDVASLKGEITRQQLQTVPGAVANSLPKEIMEHHRDIASCVDIMFVNRIPFFMSISKKVRFVTAEALNNRKQGSLIEALQRIYGVHRKRGFRITNIHGDGEFECTGGAVATDLRSELSISAKMSMSLMLNDASAQQKNALDAHAIGLLSTTALHECSLKSFF
jgi:acetolactate synthase regulatory subunit